MKNLLSKDIVLALISGLMFIPGWYEWGTGLTLLVAFIPLFIIVERKVALPQSGRQIFLLSSLTFLIWNMGTTWWIKNAKVNNEPSYAGMAAAVLITTLFMAFAFWLGFKAWKNWGRRAGLFAIVVFWLTYEFSYTHGEVSWPWLTLGNGFAYEVKLIQWYEITGTLGGSLWVLIVNTTIFSLFFNRNANGTLSKRRSIIAALLVLLPVSISLIRYYTYKEEHNPRKVVVVQPNIDPYLKFNDISPIEQTAIQVNAAKAFTDSTVDYVIAPETSIMNNIWIGEFNKVPDFRMVKQIPEQFPKLKYITGIMCYQKYNPGDELTATAKEYRREKGCFYDSYNSAIQIDSSDTMQIYHKSKLVIGVEKMPYPGLLKVLKPITMKLGGTFRSHNIQKERSVFISPDDSLKVGTVICYESVFGEFVTEYVQKGAGLLFVITNDGWWDNTPGHRQHNSLSSIRAVETRRSIARSANTGISSTINQRGDVIKKLGWWKRGAFVDEINVNQKLTFYVKHGDYIGRITFFLSVLMTLMLISISFRRKSGMKRNA